ncbi:MAG TPA: tripartite tricarboxylate transporter substrate binding protein [Xanthobacteraceae bacterium]|nr:tripartite tricarboxylate transporter substrate binding protein [Xanthobacteraceae bacterium]
MAALLLAAAIAVAPAEPQPRLVRIVVSFAAGGTADTLARLVGQEIAAASGAAVVIENRAGAGTAIATEFVYRATPDGSTLLLTADPFVINPNIRASVPYDPFAFEPLCLLVTSPQVLVVNAESPYRSVASLVMAAKARPGELTYAAVGPGTSQHIAGEMFKRAAEINMVYVPFTGGAGVVTSILGGHVTAALVNYNEVLGHIEVGKLRPLAVASHSRFAELPAVPTLNELGYRTVDATAWFGVFAPPRTPREMLGLLIAQFRSAVMAPDVKSKLEALGLHPVGACGNEFDAYLRRQHDHYARIVREANIRVE